MGLDQARRELLQAIASAGSEAGADGRYRAARLVLVLRGAEALGVAAQQGMTLPDIVRNAATAPPSPDRRSFAILLVHALGVPGLVRPNASRRSTLDRDICGFAETAIASVLVRSGYPFSGAIYDRVSFLERLHATIDEHLHPFEPTFPPWLRGVEGRS